MKKYALIKHFTIYSMLAFILTGIILSRITYDHIKKDDLTNIVEIAKISIKNIVKNDLEKADFNDVVPLDKEQQIALDINDSMQSFEIDTITLLNSKRIIVMSGKTLFSIEDSQNRRNLDKIFHDNLPFVVSDPFVLEDNATETKANISYFNLFVPVHFENNLEGVFVLQIPYEIINSHTNKLVQEIALTLSGGLLLLFLLLIGILYRTSRTMIIQNENLDQQKSEIEESYERLDHSYVSTVVAMSNAVDARDSYTAGHSARVSEIALKLGQALGLSDTELKNLEYATLFHDIGKIGISDSILNKIGKLTIEEYEIIKNHPDIGINILKDIDFLAEALPIIRHHHERFDGGGYPSGLIGDKIPLGARIVAIADTYDAMTSDRPYRLGLDHDVAVKEIKANKGKQFDGKLVDVFLILEREFENRK